MELFTPENFTYYRVMLEDILQSRTVTSFDKVPTLDVSATRAGVVRYLLMLLIDIGCKYSVFWKRRVPALIPDAARGSR